MFRSAAGCVAGVAAVVLLGGCAPPERPPGVDEPPRQLSGEVLTFSMGGQRMAVALFTPPATMLLVRTGPVFFWATPSPGLRSVYLQDVVTGQAVDTHVLRVNPNGMVDYRYAFDWS